MRVLYMGTPDFAAGILQDLIRADYDIIGVVTQPDKQKGRGKEVSSPPVKELALKHNIPVYQPSRVRDPEFILKLKELAPEIIIVAAFGQILSKELLDIPPLGCINVHASLLPRYRGSAPIQKVIIDGEQVTGITIMHMDAGIDTGDMILQEEIPIEPHETGGSLHDKLSVLGGHLLLRALKQIQEGTAERIPQDDSKATYVKMIDKEMGNIDFTMPAVQIERLIRGLNPWPSAFTRLEGKVVKLWSAEVEEEESGEEPGTVIELRSDAIVAATGKGKLVIRELQLEGKKRMSAEAFLRGYKITELSKFTR